jgi:hypothetical protein
MINTFTNEVGSDAVLITIFPFLAHEIFGLKIVQISKDFMSLVNDEIGREFDEHLSNYDPGKMDIFI